MRPLSDWVRANQACEGILAGTLVVLSLFSCLFSEWLFFATKPSFMSTMEWPERIVLLFRSAAPLLLLGILLLIPPLILAFLFRKNRILHEGAIASAYLLPAIVLAMGLFLLFDNFTYTVFRFGIRTTSVETAWLYLLLLGALFGLSFRFAWKLRSHLRQNQGLRKVAVGLSCVLSAAVLLIWLPGFASSNAAWAYSGSGREEAKRPNILLIGSDGLNANHLSAYGYERPTTPFLQEFSNQTLFCENAFANSGPTAGSLASILTGRFPTSTRLIYPPDILKGDDVYRHLPALLRQFGYRTMHLSIREYADPYDLNLRHGFDESNGRREPDPPESLVQVVGTESAYFIQRLGERVSERLRHAGGLEAMEDPFLEITSMEPAYLRDDQKLKDLLRFIKAGEDPFFAHVHFLGTHGERFFPRERVFSAGERQTRDWMRDFYDDSILDFDGFFNRIVDDLQRSGRYDNTLIVLYSDHGRRYRTWERVPLLFRFPQNQFAGRIRENAQNVDIAPTILGFMGIDKPDWMQGISLLQNRFDPLRPVFAAEPNWAGLQEDSYRLDTGSRPPPFFSLRRVNVILCDRWYRMDLFTGFLSAGEVEGHTSPCDEEARDPSGAFASQRIETMILEHLRENGYDTSELRNLLLSYEWSSVIQFDAEGQARRYQNEGWGPPEISHTWTHGHRASLEMETSKPALDVILSATLRPFLAPGSIDEQNVTILVNGREAGQWKIKKGGFHTQAVSIPAEFFGDDRLILTFELPNATSPAELGLSGDRRILGLAFQSLQLSESSERTE